MPVIEARRHYGIAQFSADFKNMMGGKRPPKEASSEPPLEPHELFKPEEELPWFAYFDPPERLVWESDVLALVQEHADRLPSWARALVPQRA